MAIQNINTGTAPNSGDGDSIRSAFHKINNNFNEIVSVIGTSTTTFTEIAQDASAALLVHSSHTGIIATYVDGLDQIQLSLNGQVGPSGPTGPTGPTGIGFDGVTSTSTININTGSLIWDTLNTGAFIEGGRVRVVVSTATSNWVEGTISSIVTGTSITVDVNLFSGSGNHSTWEFTVSGQSVEGSILPSSRWNIAFYTDTGTVVSGSTFFNVDPITQRLHIGDTVDNVSGSLLITRNTTTAGITPASSNVYIADYHTGQDTSNFTFFRARGTPLIPRTVLDDDEIAEVVFLSYNGTITSVSASYGVIVDGTPTLTDIPGKFVFAVNTGSGLATVAAISSSATWKINKIGHLSSTTSTIEIAGNLVPSTNLTYDLGSTSSQWRSLYAGTLTFPDNTSQGTAFQVVSAPAFSTSTGVAKTFAYDSSYFYVCTATNSWQRIAWDNTPW